MRTWLERLRNDWDTRDFDGLVLALKGDGAGLSSQRSFSQAFRRA
jgi:hypothetical protein